MTFEWINESNAVWVAQYLLDLDVSCIESIYQEDVESWVINLKQARERYLHHVLSSSSNVGEGLSSSKMNSQLGLVNYSLNVLLQRIHAFLPLLTSYGIECLRTQLTKTAQQKI
jgi:hypothetical protein